MNILVIDVGTSSMRGILFTMKESFWQKNRYFIAFPI